MFAFNPDDKPARIIRFVHSLNADVTNGDVIAVLDVEKNILYIDRVKWAQLSPTQQHIIERTHAPITRTPVLLDDHPQKETLHELEGC